MRLRILCALFAVSFNVAFACSIGIDRKLWQKNPEVPSDLFAFEQYGRIGFINHSGRVIIEAQFEAPIDDVGDFVEGLARIGKEGYIDETGKWIIKRKYRYTEDFSSGLALITIDGPKKYSTRSMYIDRTGKVVLEEPKFQTRSFSGELAAFEMEGRPGIRRFSQARFEYKDFPGLKGFIDRTGTIVIKPRFADVGPFVDGVARVVVDGYCHVESEQGEFGTPTTGFVSSCGAAPSDAIHPCPVGFIDSTGKFAIEPRFESARDFQQGLAAVKIDGAWGFINIEGRGVIAPKFARVQDFHEGLAAVLVNGKWGFIDKQGNAVVEARFEAVKPFSEQLAIAFHHGRPVYIDRTGNIKLAGPFKEATPFVHGLAAVLLSEHDVAYIDKTGSVVFRYWRN